METFDENDIQYQLAKKQVDRLRGFYGHLFAYIAVNAVIVVYNCANLKPGESYFQLKTSLRRHFGELVSWPMR